MDLPHEYQRLLTRRHFFGRTATGIGTAALASLLNERLFAADKDVCLKTHGVLPALHFAPKAKHVIYLFMSGGPSHIDLFDYKPKLRDYHGKELPATVRMGQRVTGMTSGQKSFPCVAPMFKFARHAPPHARRRQPVEPAGGQVLRRPGDQYAHRPVRDGLPHADLGAGTDRPLR